MKRKPALNAKIVFEDHIRCLATKQSLQKHKEQLRQDKMACIAKLLGASISLLFSQGPIPVRPPSPILGVDVTDSLQTLSSSHGTNPDLTHSVANQILTEENQSAGIASERRASEIYEMDVLNESKQVSLTGDRKVLSPNASNDSVRYSPTSQQVSISHWIAIPADPSNQDQSSADESSLSEDPIISAELLESVAVGERSPSLPPKHEITLHPASTNNAMAASNSITPTLSFNMSSEHIITPTKTENSVVGGSSGTGCTGMSFGGIGILAGEPSHEEGMHSPSPRQPAHREGNLIILDPESPQLFF